MRVLVTGSAGMIGSCLVDALINAGYDVVGVDRREGANPKATNIVADLGSPEELGKIFRENQIDRVIHLAALAHSVKGKNFSWDDYYHINVKCARNIFDAAGDRPLLFISTVDVYGFTKGTVTVDTEPQPISDYAKSKRLAEKECMKLPHYSIYRFSPVYTDTVKRDIQKRYYLKYPNIAYRIGKGTEYEILNVRTAIGSMVDWCASAPENDIRIIKDRDRMKTQEYIAAEKAEGRAKTVLYLPRWAVISAYAVLKAVTGKNGYTYLLNKAVHPLRSE